jgi:hypothetical protein
MREYLTKKSLGQDIRAKPVDEVMEDPDEFDW